MNVQAPPSNTYKIVEIDVPFKDVVSRRALPGVYTSIDDNVNPWVPWGHAEVKYLGFDLRQNITYVHLRMRGPGVIGTHYHHGLVVLMPIEGTFRYLEYNWLAKKGDFVFERPGEAHTLVTDDPNGCIIFGELHGTIDFYDDQANFLMTADVFTWLDHYESYCREQGIQVPDTMFL